MINENEQPDDGEINHATENLESVGQMIIGAVEQIGGVLTGDPTTRAEGEFNSAVGNLHQDANKNLTAIENRDEALSDEHDRNEK